MKKITLLFLFLLVLAGCGAASGDESMRYSTDSDGGAVAEEAEAMEAPAGQPMPGETSGGGDESFSPENQSAVERRIIYSANISIRVDNPLDVSRQMEAIAESFGGYVSSANVYELGGREDVYQANVQLRVAADQFNPAMERLRSLGTEVISEEIGTQDVTDRYVDLEARIDNLERTEDELQVLLTEARENNGRTEDVLAVYRELTTIRGEIEVLQGQLNVLSDSVSLATINVQLNPPEAQVQVLDEEWSFMTGVRRALRTLTDGLQGLVDAAVFLIIAVLPIILLVLLPLFLFVRFLIWLMRRRSDSTPVPAAPAGPPAAE